MQTKTDVVKHFRKLFEGIGKLKEYTILLNRTPYALYTPHCIAIPLLPKEKKRAGTNEDNGSRHSDMLTNRVVHRYGGGSQGGWEGAYMCRSHTAESECVSRKSSTTSPTVQQTLAQ